MPTYPDHLWIGNHLALDLVNTTHLVGGERVDLLEDVDALASWATRAGLLDDGHHRAAFPVNGREASRSLAFTHRLRRTLRDVLDTTAGMAPATGAAPFRADRIGELNEILREAPGTLHVGLPPGPPDITLTTADGPAAQLRLDIAAAAVDLFGHDPNRVRRCEGAGCELWFLDVSKSGRRRWCDMATCGNRAKAAAHHARAKGARSGAAHP